jgi:hypothetical protein
MLPQTSKNDRLGIGPYRLPRQQEIVAPVTTADKMAPIDIVSLQNRLLEVCYVPATSAGLSRLLFLFLRWPLTVLMKQARQAVCAFKQSILLRCL